MGGSKSPPPPPPPPPPPDPFQVSAAQTAQNVETARETARLNALDIFTPFGTTSYVYDPLDPRNDMGQLNRDPKIKQSTAPVPTGQRVEFADDVQAFINQQMDVSRGMADHTIRQLGYFPDEPFSLTSIPDTGELAERKMEEYRLATAQDWEKYERDLQAMLMERGIPIGSEVWEQEMNRFEKAKADQFRMAAFQAQDAATGEFQRLLGNALMERRLPFDEMNLYQGATPGVQQPPFVPANPVGIAGTDVSGNVWNAYNAQLGAWQTQAQAAMQPKQPNPALGLIGSLGGAAIGKSAEELKEKIEPVSGEEILAKLRDTDVAEWEYDERAQALLGLPDGRHMGPMAGDVHEEFPDDPMGSDMTVDLMSQQGRILAAIRALDERTQHLRERDQ